MMLDSDKDRPHDSCPDDRRPRLTALLFALGAAWAAVIVLVVDVHLPLNAIKLPGEDTLGLPVRSVAPQGWAFFTRPAREERMTVWGQDDQGQWSSRMMSPHSEPRNGFGFNRTSRAQGVEMGVVSAPVQSDDWSDCDTARIADCLAGLDGEPVEVANPGPSPTLCGSLALVAQEPVPWAWKRDAPDTVMPVRVAPLEVSC